MRTRFFILFLSGLLAPGFYLFAQVQLEKGIRVTASNLRNNKGHVLISLFKDGVGYPDEPEKAFRKAKAPISNKSAAFLFNDVPPGTYAVAILHDENNDTKMNKNVLGIPKEGYGFSNNAAAPFGPPSHRKASFPFTANSVITVTIKTRYQ